MSFVATFSNALSGISASTLRAEILSFNIANAQTENFARRSVSFEPQVPGGVRASAVERVSAGRSEAALIRAETRAAGTDVRSQALTAMNDGFGEPGDPDGLYAAAIRFEQSIADLRLTPESTAAQTGMLRAAQDLTQTFSRLDAEAQTLRLDADRAIGRSVERLNDTFRELTELNAEARRPRGVALDNVAERQRALVREVARDLDIVVTGEYGAEISIRTRGGFLLVGEEPGVLAFTPSGSMAANLSYAAGTLSGLSIDGIDITPGMIQGLEDGNLAAQFAVRDALATDYASRLDRAARDLVQRTEINPFSGASLPGLFVLETGSTSAADRLRVNDAVDPAKGGELFRLRDGVNATVPGPSAGDGVLGTLEDALKEVLSPGPTTFVDGNYGFVDSLGALSTALGTQALRGASTDRSASDALSTVSTEVGRLTGVDTDRELQDLLLVEQAFAANARVIQAADDMLRQLLQV